MNLPASSSESSAFHQLDARIQKWVWQAGWTELKDAQERAIPVILQGSRDVIIAAATASGKTEAAFFPILTRMLSSKEPASALYISPLKALINDQWMRLGRLCEALDIPVIPWHGDISASIKRKFQKDPRGCLLITPESLEGLLMREGHALARILGGLRYIVVDELHAFIDTERGKQLQSLMHRVDVALDQNSPRIGLSATLGEMELAAEFLRPGASGDVEIINSHAGGQELRVIVKGYYNSPPWLSEKEVEAREATGLKIERGDLISEGAVSIGKNLFESLRGTNNLVFPNSRNRVELYADLLRRECEGLGVPNEFWPHHGSLSKEIREETERALKAGDRPATAIATTTLELGIDLGAVKSIAQVGPAPSVASLRQRLGRSGRRKNEAAILRCYCLEDTLEPDTAVSDQLREGLVQTIAQIRLLLGGWFEPPRVQSLHLSTLVQQLLSLVAQYGGLSASQAWAVLCGSGLFRGLSKAEFVELLRRLGEKEIVVQDSTGLLLLGVVGEKIVNHYSFLAAFTSVDEFRVVCQGRQLGTLPLERPVVVDSYLILAGRRWKVTACHPEDKLIEVVAAKGGKLPLFDGMGGKIHDRVRQEMREVLRESMIPGFLDAIAMTLLSDARDAYRRFSLEDRAVVPSGDDLCVFTWQGDWVNDTLVLMMNARGIRASNDGLIVTVHEADNRRIFDVLSEIAVAPPPSGADLASEVKNKYREKWDGLLPESLLGRNFASSQLDVPKAVACAARLISLAQARQETSQ